MKTFARGSGGGTTLENKNTGIVNQSPIAQKQA